MVKLCWLIAQNGPNLMQRNAALTAEMTASSQTSNETTTNQAIIQGSPLALALGYFI
jgi:hypothetical protein